MNIRLPFINSNETHIKTESEKTTFEQAQISKKLNNYQRILDYFDTHKTEENIEINPYNYKKKNKMAILKKHMVTPLEIREEAYKKFDKDMLEKKMSGTLTSNKSGYLTSSSKE
jgi:hypothetical protein